MSYIIGSGWWCAGNKPDNRVELFGDNFIRDKAFHNIWYEHICKFTSPSKILIVDSCSPILPDFNRNDQRLEFTRLNLNAGHSTNHQGKFCGYMRAILLGLEYTMQCDADYFVYIEQDALIFGKGVIEHCIDNMKTPYMFGSGLGTPGRIQQSFFVIRRDGIWPFIKKINAISYTDNRLSPEEKFHLACCFGSAELLSYFSVKSNSNRFYKWLDWQCYKYLRNYDYLPIGYGRVRPIDFSDPFFYFQHGSNEELKTYLSLTQV